MEAIWTGMHGRAAVPRNRFNGGSIMAKAKKKAPAAAPTTDAPAEVAQSSLTRNHVHAVQQQVNGWLTTGNANLTDGQVKTLNDVADALARLSVECTR
jgi:hypothetical protein